jgi:hypothetical protein
MIEVTIEKRKTCKIGEINVFECCSGGDKHDCVYKGYKL